MKPKRGHSFPGANPTRSTLFGKPLMDVHSEKGKEDQRRMATPTCIKSTSGNGISIVE